MKGTVMEEKNTKKRIRLKKIIRVILAVLAVVLLIGGIIFLVNYRKIAADLDMNKKIKFMRKDTGATDLHLSLTEEQKLKDLDYLYDLVCLQNPKKELFEEVYGISYEELYDFYRELALNSEDEYEYFSYVASFLAVLPGNHNSMFFPNYPLVASTITFGLTDLFATQEMKDYSYSWIQEFRDDVERYDEPEKFLFSYRDGKYIGSSGGDFSSDFAQGELISIDGKDPKELCFAFVNRQVPIYDSGNECFFRDYLIFNDEFGLKHSAEVRMPDGTVVTREFYEHPGVEIAINNRHCYSEQNSVSQNDPETSVETSESQKNETKKEDRGSYYIATDVSKQLVYIYTSACDSSEGGKLAKELKTVLKETDPEYVILDIRENSGGASGFVTEQLLPVLFCHDVEYRPVVMGTKNDHTRNFYENPFYAGSRSFSSDEKYFYYTEYFSVKGKAKKNYRIYVMTSQDSFSSADILTNLCKEYDNAVIVGTNTKGEGISGSPLCAYLPESHFMFDYMATVNQEHPENSYYGTMPDIYLHSDPESIAKKKELRNLGEEYNTYEARKNWDSMLIRVLEMIDEEQ